jgi:hypothetical protein
MDEVGRLVRVDLGIDLTGNTEIVVHVQKPDGGNYEVTRVAVADITVDDAATGQISYETEVAYHDEVGEYFLQAKVDGVPNSGDVIYSPITILGPVEHHMTFVA